MKNYYIREKKGDKFVYTNVNGKPIHDKKILEEIKKIYIAPAYRDVKIYLNSDLLATGVDEAGRTQYIYSSNFKLKREKKKFCQLVKISQKIEVLNNQVAKDLDHVKYTKEKLSALVIRIMNICNFRGGNKSNEKLYKHHGITTLHKKHITFEKGRAIIDFIGKKGVQNICEIKNPEMIHLLKDLYRRSTKKDPYLFSIKNEDGEEINVNLNDVNEYLAPYDITSKDLRTWNANVIFLKNLFELMPFYQKYEKALQKAPKKSEKKELTLRKKIIRSAIEKTAHALHNTPAICKSSYLLKSMISNFETYPHYLGELAKHPLTAKNENYAFEKYFTSILKDHGNYQKLNCNKCNSNKLSKKQK